ncbi:hypothetical protein [Glycomyces tenuis]|uniref:hypothetical protein n=1 Tax=Glycomyces tenuis TaxID=58116 RepID=UPI000416EFFC|nr:hypothetical protein [Glycomyces tenuis]
MTVSVAIMAHPKRSEFIPELEAQLDRPATVAWDDGSNSRWGTGRRALLAYEPAATHHLVIQDDAVIPRDLVAGVEAALQYTPGDVPVCLYVGKTRPYREMVREYVKRAEQGASWLVMDQINWGVAIVFPTNIIDDMVAWCDTQRIPNYDSRMSLWFEHQGIPTWYPWPSLVDHRESPSLVPGRGHSGRVAHRFIGADVSALDIDYSGDVLRLPSVSDYRPGGQPMLFYCTKHDNLSVPTIGVRFKDHFAEATTRGAIAYLQSPFMRRRGVRPATEEEEAAWRGETTGGPVLVQEPAPVNPPATQNPAPDGQHEAVPDGKAEEVLAWVGDDPSRAQGAIDAEQQREKPRKTLLAKLETIARAE